MRGAIHTEQSNYCSVEVESNNSIFDPTLLISADYLIEFMYVNVRF